MNAIFVNASCPLGDCDAIAALRSRAGRNIYPAEVRLRPIRRLRLPFGGLETDKSFCR